MSVCRTAARNREIIDARAAGQSLRQIGRAYDISHQRVRAIVLSGGKGSTLLLLPGTETLSPATRGLLIRLGYRDANAVRAAVGNGTLRYGCTFDMGARRFSEIETWAREADAR